MKRHAELIAGTQAAHNHTLKDLTPDTLRALEYELTRLLGIVQVLGEEIKPANGDLYG